MWSSLVWSSRTVPNTLSRNPSFSYPSCSPPVWCLCVWQWVWHPSMLSHALLSVSCLQHCESTILPLSSTCSFGTVKLTISSALCLFAHPLSPPSCLWGRLSPSDCLSAHRLPRPSSVWWGRAVWIAFFLLPCSLVPVSERKIEFQQGSCEALWN